jgi:hypothetical protein
VCLRFCDWQEIALVQGLADCYDQGLVRAVGVSNYGPKQLKKVAKEFGKRGVPLASVQVRKFEHGGGWGWGGGCGGGKGGSLSSVSLLSLFHCKTHLHAVKLTHH